MDGNSLVPQAVDWEPKLVLSGIAATNWFAWRAIGWSDFQLRKHLAKLVELEYVLVHRGRRGRRFVYEILYDGQGQQGEPFCIGLIDPSQLPKFEHPRPKFEPVLFKN